MRSLDTSLEAASVQLEAYRCMTPQARLRAALELTEVARSLLTAGVRKRHPEYDEDQVRMASIRLWLGHDQFRAAYPHEPELEP
jgi:hypothetical protein